MAMKHYIIKASLNHEALMSTVPDVTVKVDSSWKFKFFRTCSESKGYFCAAPGFNNEFIVKTMIYCPLSLSVLSAVSGSLLFG